MVRKLDWEKVVESNILVLKENDTIRVKFLDNGSIDDLEITDKQSGESKIIDKYVFQVLDSADKQEKEFSTLAKRLMIQLKEFFPLKQKILSIHKFRTGADDFDIDYRVSESKD